VINLIKTETEELVLANKPSIDLDKKNIETDPSDQKLAFGRKFGLEKHFNRMYRSNSGEANLLN
jgi:hypothetical protein